MGQQLAVPGLLLGTGLLRADSPLSPVVKPVSPPWQADTAVLQILDIGIYRP